MERINQQNHRPGEEAGYPELVLGDAVLEKEREVLYWLSRISFLGEASIRKMWEKAGSFREIYNIEGKAWETCGILQQNKGGTLEREKRNFSAAIEEYHSLGERGIKFTTILDQAYPERLKVLEHMPLWLFYKGKLPEDDRPSLAVIGSRKATRYGLEIARCFGRELGREGVQIISGLAAGIDGAGQKGTLEGGGSTYGVLGCGINICYPKEHYILYEETAAKGGILSEYCLGAPPLSRNFPVRNRIISGLSDGVLVVEAREKSGSLITAGLGLNQGKDIFAIPGRITDPGSAGCNQLIQMGAIPALGPGDILEYFGIKYEKKLSLHEKNEKGLAKKEKMVYSFIDLHPKHLEDIVNESGLPLSECMMILLDLELKGFAISFGGNYYGRKL